MNARHIAQWSNRWLQHAKPLNATTRQVLVQYRLVGCHGRRSSISIGSTGGWGEGCSRGCWTSWESMWRREGSGGRDNRCCRRGGRIVVEGGHIIVVEPQRHNLGKRCGRGDNDDSCRRRGCVIIVSIVEWCGQKSGWEGGRRKTITTMAERMVASLLSTSRHRWHLHDSDPSC